MKTNHVFEAIAALDLSPIKTKLMHKASGEGWSAVKADAIELEYRRFLYLMHTFPNEEMAPTVDVDIFWHYHILDTMKYATDCEQVFGYFLHHYPYVGLETAEEEGFEERGGHRTQELYEQTFGQPYIREEAYGSSAAAAYCLKAGSDSAYCLKAGRDAAYCLKAGSETAYCLKAEAKAAAKAGSDAAYCLKAGKQAAYCLKAPTKSGSAAAYCLKHAAIKSGSEAAYCLRRPTDKDDGDALMAPFMITPARSAAPIVPA